MFKNKHITIAMVVAPLLAIASYFATDYIVSDLPVSATQGESYALVARSNCRYQSGQCTFRNGDLEVKLQLAENKQGQRVLRVQSSHPLTGAQVALVNAKDQDSNPTSLTMDDKKGKNWTAPIQGSLEDKAELRIAMLSDNTTFYGSTGTTFFKHDAIYPNVHW